MVSKPIATRSQVRNAYHWATHLGGSTMSKRSILNNTTYSANKMQTFNAQENTDEVGLFSQTSPCFYLSAVQVFWKLCGEKKEIAHN